MTTLVYPGLFKCGRLPSAYSFVVVYICITFDNFLFVSTLYVFMYGDNARQCIFSFVSCVFYVNKRLE
uniref:Uncharacterized protein n=1 Tax=Lepeophtheirus salmonis TaxID=72036 RepID=A0A0K2VIL8_LEPSM